MDKLEIGPIKNHTPDGMPVDTWHTLDVGGTCDSKVCWGEQTLPFEDESFDWVYASHVLEHVAWWNVKEALKEAYRVLKTNGRLTIWVPDVHKIMNIYDQDENQLLKLEESWDCGSLNSTKDPWIYANARIFWGARPNELGESRHWHKSMYGIKSLTGLLYGAGFIYVKNIERQKQEINHGWMELGLIAIK